MLKGVITIQKRRVGEWVDGGGGVGGRWRGSWWKAENEDSVGES